MKSFLYSITLLLTSLLGGTQIASAAQALVLTNTQAGFGQGQGMHFGWPNTAPFNNRDAVRIEFRMHGCAGNGIYANLATFKLAGLCNGDIGITDWQDGSYAMGVTLPNHSNDFIVRIQRIRNTGSNSDYGLHLEVFDAAGGDGGYASRSDQTDRTYTASLNLATDQNYWGYITTLNLDYFRAFSSTVTLGTQPAASGGDLIDLEFEGNLNDSSTNNISVLSENGGPTYTATPSLPPIVSFTAQTGCFISTSTQFYPYSFCTATTASYTLHANATTPNQGDTLTYLWTQTAGPSATIVGPTTASPTINGMTQFGEYDFQLTATDSESHSTSATLKVGRTLVQSTNNCLINDVPSNLQYLIGPLTPWGSTCDPWPWYDIAEAANAEVLPTAFSEPDTYVPAGFASSGYGNSAMPGLISVNNSGDPGTASITGDSNTHFTTACAGMKTRDNVPTSGDCSNVMIAIWWNADGGTGNGRAVVSLGTVHDDQHADIYTSQYKWWTPTASAQNVHWSVIDINQLYVNYGYSSNLGGSYNWNYYDVAMAFYRLYYRTGITSFLNHADRLADAWYIWNTNRGYSVWNATPRILAIPGLMVRAIKDHPEYWTGITSEIQGRMGIYHHGGWVPSQGNWDVREEGYSLSYAALLAKLSPDSSVRADACSSVVDSLTDKFPVQIITSGPSQYGVQQDGWVVNWSYVSWAPGAGVEPFLLAVTSTGLRDAYRVMNDPTACNRADIAASTDTMLTNLITYMRKNSFLGRRSVPDANGGGQSGYGLSYMLDTVSSGEGSFGPSGNSGNNMVGVNGTTLFYDHVGVHNGTISTTQGSTTVVGVNTHFTTTFFNSPYGNGVHRDFIGTSGDNNFRGEVASVTDDTHLVLTAPAYATTSNEEWNESPADYNTSPGGCFPSKSTYCFGGANTDLLNVNQGIIAWMYAHTGKPVYKIWSEEYLGTSFGGPIGGPGTNGAPVGPYSSGNTTGQGGFINALPSCSLSPAPCGGVWVGNIPGSPSYHWAKEMGDTAGWVGATANALAYINGAPPM